MYISFAPFRPLLSRLGHFGRFLKHQFYQLEEAQMEQHSCIKLSVFCIKYPRTFKFVIFWSYMSSLGHFVGLNGVFSIACFKCLLHIAYLFKPKHSLKCLGKTVFLAYLKEIITFLYKHFYIIFKTS